MRFKISFCVFLFLLMSIILNGQDTTYTHYDYRGNKVSKKKSIYYTIKSYQTVDGRYIQETINRLGGLIEKKSYLSKKMDVLDGYCIVYLPEEKLYGEGLYKNNKRFGEWKFGSNYIEKTEEYDENGLLDGTSIGYHPNGEKSYMGQYSSDNKIGIWFSYYKGGELNEIERYNPSGKLEGASISFYENGDTLTFGDYKENERIGEWKSFYEGGKIKREEYYILGGLKHGVWSSYYEGSDLRSQGSYLNDSLDGVWNWYHKDGQESSIEKYENGKLIEFQFYDELGNEENYSEKPEVMPEFPGGMEELFKFLGRNINYPPIAQEQGIAGRVVLRFKLDLEGNIHDIEIVKDIGGGCGEEGKRVIEMMPQWTKSVNHNLDEKIHYTLPIKFTLE